MVAMIISSTAKTMNIFICGMTLAGERIRVILDAIFAD